MTKRLGMKKDPLKQKGWVKVSKKRYPTRRGHEYGIEEATKVTFEFRPEEKAPLEGTRKTSWEDVKKGFRKGKK